MTEVQIRDYEREEVVGRVDDSGVETDDELLSDVLADDIFSEGESIEIVYPVAQDSYQIVEVGPGDEGYARTLVDELPSPFDINDLGNLDELPVYHPDSVEEKAVQVVNLEKDRVYIDDPAEAPPGVDVQHGQQGGLYYVPVGEEDDEGTVDAPENMISIDPDDVERDDFISVEDVEGFVSNVDHVGGKARIQFTTGETVEVNPESQVFINDQKDPSGEEPTEIERLVGEVEFSDFPSSARFSEVDAASHLESVAGNTRDDVRDEVFESISVKDDSPVSQWDTDNNTIHMHSEARDMALSHEIGHAMVGVFGSDIEPYANMPAHVYSGEMLDVSFGETRIREWALEQVNQKIESDPLPRDVARQQYQETINKIEDEFDEDEVFEVEDFRLKPPEEGPEEIAQLVEQANSVFEKQNRAARADVPDEEYYIGKAYSSMNAHETVAMTQEVLQGGAADRQSIENLYLRYSEYFEAWLEIFEPDHVAKAMMNTVYEEHGPNRVFDEMPYSEVAQ